MPIGAIPSNDPSDGGTPVISAPDAAPAWMKVRRDRQIQTVEKQPVERKPVETPLFDLQVVHELPIEVVPSPKQPELLTESPISIEAAGKNDAAGTLPVFDSPPPLTRLKKKRKASLIPSSLQKHWLVVSVREKLNQWVSKQTMISMSFSLAIHTLVLLSLAFFVIRSAQQADEISLWGTVGDPNEGGEEMELDTAIPNDEGESAPIMIDSVAQNLDLTDHGAVGEQLPNAARVGSGGKGNGEGESGTGSSMGVSGLRVPGHAQTKGSFSAWADPRDPEPGKDYHIVIRVQLPKNIKKYKASDLTGMVIGTDKYEQKIQFKPGETFPIEDGAIVIRVRVPGGGRLVRDNIKIESKLLKEKQKFQIEF